ncbi:MAG TPA: TetR family transcriptional regulator [Nocardioidaceae bacterium]|nr:TetR family transcriptional regulator [Nocardioidaceae bacterium]
MAGPTVETRQERKERTRQAILDAALELVAEEGLAALSLRQLTRAVGIVPTAFYRHFASVDELGLALVDRSFASLRLMIREARQGNPQLAGVIRSSVAILVQHVHSDRTYFRFIARERFGGVPVVRQAIRHELELFERELATDLGRLPGLETWTAEDLRVMANLVVNAMVSTAEDILDAPPERPEVERRIVRTAEKQLRMIVVGAVNWRST